NASASIAAHPTVPSNGNGATDSVLAGLAGALSPYLETRFREIAESVEQSTDALLDLVREEIAAHNGVTRVEVRSNGETEYRDMGVQHKLFPLLLQACSARTSDGHAINVWLKGPAGSGKTTAAANVARALDLQFYFCGSISDAFALLGFVD